MAPWILYALLSAFFASLVAVFGKVGLQNIDSTVATTVRAVVMALFLLITTLVLGKFQFVSQLTGKTGLFIILSGMAGAVSWLFYFTALKVGPASGVASLDRLSVVFVFILALLFLGEALTLKHALGVLLIVAGALLMV